MTDRPHILLAHHLKTLKLPTFLREYEKVARHRSHGRWTLIEHPNRLSGWCRASPDSVVVTSAGLECK